MLIITRKPGERIMLGDDVVIEVHERQRLRLGRAWEVRQPPRSLQVAMQLLRMTHEATLHALLPCPFLVRWI